MVEILENREKGLSIFFEENNQLTKQNDHLAKKVKNLL